MEREREDEFEKEGNNIRRIFGLMMGGREDVFGDGQWDAPRAQVNMS